MPGLKERLGSAGEEPEVAASGAILGATGSTCEQQHSPVCVGRCPRGDWNRGSREGATDPNCTPFLCSVPPLCSGLRDQWSNHPNDDLPLKWERPTFSAFKHTPHTSTSPWPFPMFLTPPRILPLNDGVEEWGNPCRGNKKAMLKGFPMFLKLWHPFFPYIPQHYHPVK